jgi:hypothetical protein
VGPRLISTVWRRENIFSCRDSNPGPFNLWPSRYTEYIIPVPLHTITDRYLQNTLGTLQPLKTNFLIYF